MFIYTTCIIMKLIYIIINIFMFKNSNIIKSSRIYNNIELWIIEHYFKLFYNSR